MQDGQVLRVGGSPGRESRACVGAGGAAPPPRWVPHPPTALSEGSQPPVTSLRLPSSPSPPPPATSLIPRPGPAPVCPVHPRRPVGGSAGTNERRASRSPALTYSCSSRHFSARKEPRTRSVSRPQATAHGPCPPPRLPAPPALRALESALVDLKTATTAHHSHPSSRPCSSQQKGGPVPTWAQSRPPAPGRSWPWAVSEPQCGWCPCVPLGTPPHGSCF